ncbi:WD repeat protein, regulatory associated protein of mTOR [Pseudohyphozyma bogoriensis]|nr:WD repeat protein, regulatory associated protein of mTOR [Pseudohyphozyma bogoriensis]
MQRPEDEDDQSYSDESYTSGSETDSYGDEDDPPSTLEWSGELDGDGNPITKQLVPAEDANVRHGFAEAYSSDEYLKALEASYFMYWTDPRHQSSGIPAPPPTDPASQKIDWRNRDRIRTAAAVLVVCLRIGYDPPDVIKTDPCAKLECWIDPYASAKDKAMERIGKNLQTQFESLAATPKTRYKQFLDPPIEDAKKFCTAARKSAKNERVLFYYNGHGVPKPTASGELWLFNKQYTQYIPVSLAEVIMWLGSPSIMVWDCSAAGNIVTKVQEFGAKRDADLAREAAAAAEAAAQAQANGTEPPPPESKPHIPSVPFRDTIQLGACLGHQTLPMNPELPADLFTACLTSPIEMAIRFFQIRNPLKNDLTLELLLEMPGKLNDRRTPLGELTWIFTAVTDTIAWNTLPRDLFQKLFRHDLVVAALFRGFLLAERIMRYFECTPISVPALPPTHNHPLWDSWDLAVDMCIQQLPGLLAYIKKYRDAMPQEIIPAPQEPGPPSLPPGAPPLPYVHSNFFAEQLRAFEIWLQEGGVERNPHPVQLPVVLQVLLSQAHRLRALILLCKFLDLGPWAVNVALSIGIFAYVLRLLQAPAAELKPVLIYIWARILAVYENCKEDLLKSTYPPTRTVDQAPYTYFVSVLAPSGSVPIPNVSEHRAMCAFILGVCCRDYKPGQAACLRANVFDACLAHVRDVDPLLRQWSALCIAMMWDDFEEAKGLGIRGRVHELFCSILHTDPVPEVRAAVLYALGTLLGTTGSSSPTKKFGKSIVCSGPAAGLSPIEQSDVELGVAMATLKCSTDGSPLVRRELVILLSSLVNEHQGQFIIAAYRAIVERSTRATEAASKPSSESGMTDETLAYIAASLNAAAESDEGPSNPAFQATLFSCMYKTIFDMMADPFPDIADSAGEVMDHILKLLFESPLGPAAKNALRNAPPTASTSRFKPPPAPAVTHIEKPAEPAVNGHPSRTASIATSLKSLAHQLTTSTGLTEATPVPPTSLRINGKVPGAASPTSPVGALHGSASTDSLRYLQSRAGKPVAKPKPGVPTDPAAVDLIIAGLIAEDEERLRRRRAAPSVSGEEPSAQVLPLKSTFFDWAQEYYKGSQMQMTEGDEPGSVAYNQRLWRRARNESIIIKTQPMKIPAGTSRWDEQIGFNTLDTIPTKIAFHQFERHLLAADKKGNINVYDWEQNKRLNRFTNGTSPSVPISSVRFVNEDDVALVMSGSADGHVRLFRDYAEPGEVHLVSSFQGIQEQLPTTTKQADAGLVLEWQQGRGQLLMGGNVKFIRVWDAQREVALQDLPTRANSCLTSLTCDQVAGNILVGGFGDGSVKVYDRRITPRDNMIRSYKGHHHSWIVNVHMQRGGNRELLSGGLGGEVCLWDIRLSEPIRTLVAHQGGMSQLAVHEHAPVFATSSAANIVKVWNMNGVDDEPISKFRNSAGFMTQRTFPMTSMAFHPHHMILGCASEDSHINTFQIENYGSSLLKVQSQLAPLGMGSRMAAYSGPP